MGCCVGSPWSGVGLQVLDLTDNAIGSEGAISIAKALVASCK